MGIGSLSGFWATFFWFFGEPATQNWRGSFGMVQIHLHLKGPIAIFCAPPFGQPFAGHNVCPCFLDAGCSNFYFRPTFWCRLLELCWCSIWYLILYSLSMFFCWQWQWSIRQFLCHCMLWSYGTLFLSRLVHPVLNLCFIDRISFQCHQTWFFCFWNQRAFVAPSNSFFLLLFPCRTVPGWGWSQESIFCVSWHDAILTEEPFYEGSCIDYSFNWPVSIALDINDLIIKNFRQNIKIIFILMKEKQ